MIRGAHHSYGAPFLSIAFANHGPAETIGTDAWVMAKDLEIDATPGGTAGAITKMAPLMEVMMATLAKDSTAHIAFLACSLAGESALPGLIPAMEGLYGIDCMASTNTTGNATEGGDWTLETDDFSFNKVYCDQKQLEKYRQTMCFQGGYATMSGGGDPRNRGMAHMKGNLHNRGGRGRR